MANREVPVGKIPPQNLDAEKSLLGAVLIDEETLADISEHVTVKDFYEKRHSIIYGGMMRLYEHHKPVDLLTLTDELKRKKELDTVGRVLDFSVIGNLLCQWLEENWDHKFLIFKDDPWVGALLQVDPAGVVVTDFNPTAENMSDYLLNVIGPQQLKDTGCVLQKVKIEETRKCSVVNKKGEGE